MNCLINRQISVEKEEEEEENPDSQIGFVSVRQYQNYLKKKQGQ